jgi:hypothetical protein
MQGQRGDGAPAIAHGPLAPGQGQRIVEEVLVPHRAVFAHGGAYRTAAVRIVGIDGDQDAVEIFQPAAGTGHRQDPARGLVIGADPGHLHLAELDHVAANGAIKLVGRGTVHDGLIAFAERGVKPGQAPDAILVGAPRGDVAVDAAITEQRAVPIQDRGAAGQRNVRRTVAVARTTFSRSVKAFFSAASAAKLAPMELASSGVMNSKGVWPSTSSGE